MVHDMLLGVSVYGLSCRHKEGILPQGKAPRHSSTDSFVMKTKDPKNGGGELVVGGMGAMEVAGKWGQGAGKEAEEQEMSHLPSLNFKLKRGNEAK